MVADAAVQNVVVANDVETDAFQAITTLSIYTQSHPRLLAAIAGSCASAGARILSAQISTTRAGMALDTFRLQRDYPQDEDEVRRVARIVALLEKQLRGQVTALELIAQPNDRLKTRLDAFDVETEIAVDNDISSTHTVVEVSGLDRPGILYAITSALSDLNLDINSAHISTFGERIIDSFYVTDLVGKKIFNERRRAAIEQRLQAVMNEEHEVPVQAV